VRQFGSSGFRLWNLGAEAKVLYTAFCLLTLLGVVSSALFYMDLVGTGTRGIRRYYAGEAEPAAAERSSGGPALELPPGERQEHAPLVVAVSYRKLLEVTHFHLFTMPVVLLIVGHLFLATGFSNALKRGFIIGGAASVALHLATPWLVRSFPSLALLHALSGLALTITMTVLTLGPVGSMWRGPGGDRAPARPAS
jgi:hypothetical protein